MCFTPLFTVKLLYLTWFSASSCLLPFLSLHMRTLGVPALECSIINGILPLLQLITCPLACLIPTQSATFKKSVLWCLLFTAITSLFLVFTPVVPTASEKTISMQFRCGPDTQPGIIVDRCNYECEGWLLRSGVEAFFTECHVDCPNRSGRFKNTADLCFDDDHGRVCHVVEVNNTLSENFIFGIYTKDGIQAGSTQCLHSMDGVRWHERYFHHVSCPIIVKDSNSRCVLSCALQEVPKQDGPSISGIQSCLQESPKAVNFAIWVYFGLRAVFHICMQVASILCERALVTYAKAQGRNTSSYRVWSYIGTAIVTPLAGLILDLPADRLSNYKLLFMLFFGMLMLNIALFSSIHIESTELPSPKDTLHQMTQLIRVPETSAILVITSLLGVIAGFLDAFLFWHLEDLSCPHYVMGITVTVGLPVGLSFLIKKCSRILRKISSGNLVAACLLLQCLRCLGYFFSGSYWWCLLLEFCGALAFHFMWASVSIHASTGIPSESAIAFRSFTCAMHYGIGRGFGAAIGGAAMIYLGFPLAFLAFGSGSGILGAGFLLLHHLLLKKSPADLMKARGDNACGTEEEDTVASLLKSPVSLACAGSGPAKPSTDEPDDDRERTNLQDSQPEGVEMA